MAFERIDQLVTQERFSFQSWNDNFGRGVWAALGCHELQIDAVRDLSDNEPKMIPAMDYVFSVDWLPYVTGKTLTEAMQNLEDRLASIPPEQLCRYSEWADQVSKAIDALREAECDDTLDDLAALPATFAAAAPTASQ